MILAHVIEFIPGIGIVRDGVVDTSQGTGLGPYTWTKPANTSLIDIHDGCGGGGKGGAGGVNASGATGGGGGASGAHLLNRNLPTVPGTTLTINLGAGGTSGDGGNTTIAWSVSPPTELITTSTLTLIGGKAGIAGSTGTSIAGAAGGAAFIGSGGAGGASTPAVGTPGTLMGTQYAGQFAITGSGSGGVGSSSASAGGSAPSTLTTTNGYSFKAGGTATGTYSGGGAAASMPWGKTGTPGAGNNAGSANASSSSGYGVGGAGAGGASSGTATGANGMPGYYRITYYELMVLPTDWISSAGISAGAVTKVQNGLMTSAAYTAPPTAAQNASQVRTELTTELGRIDVAISSRNAVAPDNANISAIKAKTDNLPASPAASGQIPASFTDATFSSAGVFAASALVNAPNGEGGGGNAPSAAENATAVRNELSTELARIDATISSRSSQSSVDAIKAKTDALPADFTAATFSSPGVFAEAALINAPVGGGGGGGDAPTAEENAAAVRVELAPELTLIGKLDVGEPEQPVIPIPAPPNDPENCLLYLDADQANVKVIVTLSDYPAAGNRLLTSKPVVGVTDSDGHLELTLKRTDRIEPAGLTYHIKSDALGINQEGVTLTADLVDLRDLIPELQ